MSALCGLYYFNGKSAGPEDITRMKDALAHRGPDGSGVWHEGAIGLAHQKLAATPESLHEIMPLRSRESGQVLLTADARVDNREELIQELHLSVQDGVPITDADLILAAYLRWGGACVKKILGDFSFAIWDGRSETIFCARDIFGVKPFYYYLSENVFCFASEIKALLVLPDVPRRLDEYKLADHLMWSWEDTEITFYRDIKRLPPATSMTVSKHGGRHQDKYWEPNRNFELKLKSDEEYAERFAEIFRESVRCRLRSPHGVGSLLSGGLDSSSVVCMARDILEKEKRTPLHAFSAFFQGVPECDEGDYIRAATEHSGIVPHAIHADRLSPFYDSKNIFWHLDEPHSCNLAMYWAGFYPAAKNAGVRVMLDGEGGDEVVSRGYPRLVELFLRFRWIELIRTAAPLSKNLKKPLREIFWLKTFRPLLPLWAHKLWRQIRWCGKPLSFDDVLISPQFSARLKMKERIEKQLWFEAKQPLTVREDDWQGLISGNISNGFEIADKTAAAFHIEHRYPFFDRRLVEFCLSLPSAQKQYRGWTKYILRRAMAGVLPEKIRWRPGKTYLDKNISRGLFKYEKQYLEKIDQKCHKLLFSYIDQPGLVRSRVDFMATQSYESTTNLLQIGLLSQWFEETKLAP